MNTQHTYTHPTLMDTFKRLSRLDVEIHKVDHQERLTVDGDITPTKKIINHKYNTYIKSMI
jgi:hypothetical protein